MDLTTIILISMIILFGYSGEYLFSRMRFCRKLNNEIDFSRFSIIIPARNEEHNIGKLLNSIKNSDFPMNQVILVNDSSTDNTESLARSFGANVLNSEKLPDGWKGKPWACWQGANFSDKEFLIFLDADTYFENGGIEKIISTYTECISHNKNEGVAVSIAPFHKIEKFYESFSSIFNIIMVGSMNAFTPNLSKKPTGLFGQSLIISRKDYFEIDGHRSVKDMILENVFMAKLLNEKKVKLQLFGGKDSISFRMYPDGFKELVDGWTKAFAKGAGQTPFGTLLNIILWITAGFIISIMLTINLINQEHVASWTLFYLAYSFQMYAMLTRLGNFKFLPTLIFPVYLIFYVIVFSRSLYYVITKKSINWKAREVNN